MNAKTRLTAEGSIPIPEDVRTRMNLTPGMTFEIDEAARIIRLTPKIGVFAPDRPRVTTEQLLNKPRYEGRTATIEEISSLSKEAILRVLLMQEQDARD